MRELVEEALVRIENGERADRVLDRILRAHRELTSDERRRVAEWTLGCTVWRGRLRAMSGGDRTLLLPLFLVEREGRSAREIASHFGILQSQIETALATAEPEDPVDALAFRRSLPRWIAKRWIDQLGVARADSLARVTNERGPVSIRANTLKTAREALRERLVKEGVRTRVSTLAPHALVIEGRANISALGAWRDGGFEVQDEASQLVAEEVRAQPGMVVVDLCAGSGGKTLALAASMRNEGRLIAIELETRRKHDIEGRLKRAGVTNVEIRIGDARDASVTNDLVGRCDAVLVDAPCSELGVLRRSPDARWRLDVDAPLSFAPLQRELVSIGAALTRPGGRMVYATCSVDRAENEDVAASVTTLRFERDWRTWPDRDGADGFYAASFAVR